MANRILLQTLLRFRDKIKTGAANFMDIAADYQKQTGDFLSEQDKAVALKEINEIAPSNVEEVDFSSDFLFKDKPKSKSILSDYKSVGDDLTDADKDSMMDNFLQGADQAYASFVNKALVDLQSASKSEQQQMVKAIIGRKGMFKYLDDADAKKLLNSVDNPGAGTGEVVGLKGDETIAEKLAADEGVDVAETILPTNLRSEKGLGSLFPKGETDSIFNQKNSNRAEVAAFMKAMREAGIKNEDVMSVVKDKTNFKRQPAYEFDSNRPKEVVDLAEGKRAATSLARAAEMNADTAIKQELLANLDDNIANYGPDWWKGMGYNEGPMGRESVGNLLESITTDINNGVIDDLVARGMDEDKAFEIMRYMGRDVRERLKYDPKAFIQKVADELEMNDIKYDMTFWDNYVDEILTRIQKPEPRFADGGLVQWQ